MNNGELSAEGCLGFLLSCFWSRELNKFNNTRSRTARNLLLEERSRKPEIGGPHGGERGYRFDFFCIGEPRIVSMNIEALSMFSSRIKTPWIKHVTRCRDCLVMLHDWVFRPWGNRWIDRSSICRRGLRPIKQTLAKWWSQPQHENGCTYCRGSCHVRLD